MKRNIVVLTREGHLEDRSWFCHDKGEADRMVRWLKDNGISSVSITHDEWDNEHRRTAMNKQDELVAAIARNYCAAKGILYLSHERYVSGWDESRRDKLRIAVEDGAGRYEIVIDTAKAITA